MDWYVWYIAPEREPRGSGWRSSHEDGRRRARRPAGRAGPTLVSGIARLTRRGAVRRRAASRRPRFVRSTAWRHHFSWANADRSSTRRAVRRPASVGPRRPDRVLATVLFTDIVGSTERAAELGDRSWSAAARAASRRWCGASSRGFEAVRWTRPATASSPRSTARRAPSAARCGVADAVRPLGLEIRAGVHTGEVRARRRQASRGSPSTPARGSAAHAGAERGARLEHRQGPRRRLRHRVRGARRARAEGRSGHMAAVRCRRCLTHSSSTPFAARSARRTGHWRASAPTSWPVRC